MKDTMNNEQALAELVKPEPEQAQEIAPGMTVEEIRAVYFNADALKEPAFRLYQLNSEGYRYYYRYDEKGEPQFYPSVTTLLKQVMPTPPALLEWMIANGKEGATEKRDLAAAYGTFMHIQFETLIINRRYDFDSVPNALLSYMERENLPEKVFAEWLPKIRKDVLAFAQFVKDYNVRPLAVEIGLYHPEYNYAGCLDLPCIMTNPKTGDDFAALVDFKSGRKGFFEEHELQLHLYMMMWNYHYPDNPIGRVFNFSPKDWRKAPSYNLKDQTDSVNAKKLPHLLALATIEDEKRDNTLTIVRGILDLDKGDISDNILTLSLAELVKSKAAAKDTPDQAAERPITKEEIEIAEKALGISKDAPEISKDAPEISKKGRKRAVKRTEPTEPINTTSEPEKPVKTENDEKLTPFDVCENYCREKNCDYCLGNHGSACIEAKARAGYVEPDEKLPWEKDMADGTGIEVEKTEDGVKVTARYFEPSQEQVAKEEYAIDLGKVGIHTIGVGSRSDIDKMIKNEQAAKDNLLNEEIEL